MILTKLDRAILHNLGRTRNPEMVAAQEEVNDKHYWLPAIGWCDDHGINEALGNAVVYDSFVHGGFGIVRKLFPETPSSGPRHWIKAYVTARHKWLQEHTNTLLHKTVYRMVTFERLIRDNNWDLKLPIHICGIDVTRGALGYDRNEEVADAT
jgi:chitosanase